MNDFCLIESGEDEKWQGQVKTRARNNHRETQRLLSSDAESLIEKIFSIAGESEE